MNTTLSHLSRLSVLSLAVVLTACGGGGSSDSGTATPAATPVVAASVGNLLTSVPTPTYAVGSMEKKMFDQLNAVRLNGGFGMLAQDPNMDKSSLNHAKYLVTNYYTVPVNGGFTWDVQNLTTFDAATSTSYYHIEKTTSPEFTGITMQNRNTVTGASTTSREVVALNRADCTSSLLNSVFHRSSMLSPLDNQFGIGYKITPDNAGAACVMQTGYKKASTRPSGWIGLYPSVDQTNVPTAMEGESPDPAPEIPLGQQGSPVTIFTDAALTSVTSFTLTAVGTTTPTPVKLLLQKDFPLYILPTEAHILPTQALKANTTYTASFKGFVGKVEVIKNWSFTTGN